MNNKKKIIWISSYPKSGNTWLRFLIANYFFNGEHKNDFNISENILYFPIPSYLKKIANKEELLLNPYSISKYWIEIQKSLNIKDGNVVFLKNHNSLVSIEGNDFTNEIFSLASIYIVRDPRDVVVSYAYYKNTSFDKIIDIMCSEKLYYNLTEYNNFPNIEILGSWKFNYTSWRDGVPNLSKYCVKYEDMIDEPYIYFKKIIDFLSKILKFNIDIDQLNFSIHNSSFANLNYNEKKYGFKQKEGSSIFFRSGKKEQWKEELTLVQIKKIENTFKNEMKILGYL